MNGQLYELAALAARYVFAALMVLIVLRAGRITLVDARRAAMLRRMSPETGIIGELLVVAGDGRAPDGTRSAVIREGMIGSARRADIRIRHGSVRRMHAWFQQTEEGFRIRAHAAARLADETGAEVRQLTLADGGQFYLGDLLLMLVLASAPEPAPRHPGEPHPGPAAEEDPFALPDEHPGAPGRTIHFFDVEEEPGDEDEDLF